MGNVLTLDIWKTLKPSISNNDSCILSPIQFLLSALAMTSVTSTDYLIVDAGPAGADLACFLGQNGELIQSQAVYYPR